jgi:hypothetical protein
LPLLRGGLRDLLKSAGQRKGSLTVDGDVRALDGPGTATTMIKQLLDFSAASRMESTSEIGKIQVSAETHALLEHRFNFEHRGLIEIRSKGAMHTWFLLRRSAVAAAE